MREADGGTRLRTVVEEEALAKTGELAETVTDASKLGPTSGAVRSKFAELAPALIVTVEGTCKRVELELAKLTTRFEAMVDGIETVPEVVWP